MHTKSNGAKRWYKMEMRSVYKIFAILAIAVFVLFMTDRCSRAALKTNNLEYPDKTESETEKPIISGLKDKNDCCLCGDGELGLVLSEYENVDGISVIDINDFYVMPTDIDLNKKYMQDGTQLKDNRGMHIAAVPNRRYFSLYFSTKDPDCIIHEESVKQLYCNACLKEIVGEDRYKYILFDHKTSMAYPITNRQKMHDIRDFSLRQYMENDYINLFVYYAPRVYEWSEKR